MANERRTRMRFMRPFTTYVFNPLSRRFVHRMPFFAVLSVRGRVSGRTYQVPINVFRHADRVVFALTYGADVDWVRNVLAAGGCRMRQRNETVRLMEPMLIEDPGLPLLPLPIRIFCRFMRVTTMLEARVAPAA